MFIIYSILGFIIEVIFASKKKFVNRGFLIGPYCPIYGTSIILIMIIFQKIQNPFLLFIMITIICSINEYLTSYIMEKLFKARWWCYSKKPYNINGRICLGNSFLFGIGGFILIKYIHPFISLIIFNLSNKTINIFFYSLFLIFIVDNIVSFQVIIKIKNVTKFIKMDNTKEINEKIKEIFNNSCLTKRLLLAFPDFKIIINDIKERIRGRK